MSTHVERNKLKVPRWYTPREPKCNVQEQVAATRDDCGKCCTPVPYPDSVIFMGMMNELEVSPKVQRSDAVNLPSSTIVRDGDGHCRLGCWISIGPGSEHLGDFAKLDKTNNPEENWDRKASQIVDTPSPTRVRRSLKQGTLRPKQGSKSNTHFNSSKQSVSMFCKLIQSS